MRNKFNIVFLLLSILLLSIDVEAQCSMCRYVAESAGENGSGVTQGLNNGILYILGIPYMLLMGVGYVLFKKRREIFNEDSE